MSSIPPSGGSNPVNPQRSPASAADGDKAVGNMAPRSVSSVDDPQKQLPEAKRNRKKKNKSLADRSAQPATADPSVKKSKGKAASAAASPASSEKAESAEKKETQKDYSKMTKEQLLEEQSQALKKAKTVSQRYETNALLGRAKQYLADPNNAPKDLKVTITLPGESKPISLIPLSEELKKNPEDLAKYQKMAMDVLNEYEQNNFQGYDPEQDTRTLEELKDIMRSTANFMNDNKYEEGERGGFMNKWEQSWNRVRFDRVTLEASEHEKNNSTVPRIKVSKPDIDPQEKKKADQKPDDDAKPAAAVPEDAQTKSPDDKNVPPPPVDPQPTGSS